MPLHIFIFRSCSKFIACLFLAISLVFCLASPGIAEPATEDAPWLHAKRLADDQKLELGSWLGFPVRVLLMERSTQSPFVAMVKDGECLVILNKRTQSWLAWNNFRGLAGLDEVSSYHFALLHEVGHCVNKLKPAFNQAVLPEGSDSELYADVFAILAAQQLLGEAKAQVIGSGVVRARLAQSGFFFRSPTHDTGSKLRVIQQTLKKRPELTTNQALPIGLLARQLVEDTLYN